jgi:hypothetical protein
MLAGLAVVLEYAVAVTESDNNSRSKVLLQVGEELANSGVCACTCFEGLVDVLLVWL